ncbi:hypothetical protein AMTR_s00047p00145320 [Amborella trichopoda]|uniref:J domain-containing protein n=2 Tax=Amborella trichopoda TaxID=13333 RepID=U5D5Q9_AMBTC|nr:hypothetical protein AMTR_s00047p00145320 [Amborella trichopoda]
MGRKRHLGKCNSRVNVNVVDVPETSSQNLKGCKTSKNRKKPSQRATFIIIDNGLDDDEHQNGEERDDAHQSDTISSEVLTSVPDEPQIVEDSDDECQMFFRGKAPCFSPKRTEHQFRTSRNRFGLNDGYFGNLTSRNRFGLNTGFASNISEDDNSDCEILEDSSGDVRAQWEKAALRRKMMKGSWNMQFEVEDQASTSGSNNESRSHSQNSSFVQKDVNVDRDLESDEPVLSSASDIVMEDICDIVMEEDISNFKTSPDDIREEFIPNPDLNDSGSEFDRQSPDMGAPTQMGDSSNLEEMDSESTKGLDGTVVDDGNEEDGPKAQEGWVPDVDALFNNQEIGDAKDALFNNRENGDDNDVLFKNREHGDVKYSLFNNRENGDVKDPLFNCQENDDTKVENIAGDARNDTGTTEFENDLVGDREKLKDTAAFKLAIEEEWANRQREIQIQAEEAQRLRKRKKLESLRLLEMEKRQKQRIEEMRETQKKDEETINLKEQLRVEVRRELDKLEFQYRDMASLLRGLGIMVGGGLRPMLHEVQAAYKQALLRFHPDRASKRNPRQMVEAEETFKLISRLKDKLPPCM